MTTARERAREAACDVDHNVNPHCERWVAADAASDVWEPIVRDLVAMVGKSTGGLDRPDITRWLEIKEALGE